MKIEVVGKEHDDGNDSGFEDEESEDEDDFDWNANLVEDNKVSQKHKQYTNLEERDREDMDFPDEVDTPFEGARERFQKFRGVKSLKNCKWDKFENLPEEYSRVWRF